MYPLFHTLLVEAEPAQAQLLVSLLTPLGAVVTHTTSAARAAHLMSLLLPDLLVIGAPQASAHPLHSWLPTDLTNTPLPTLLYTKHPALPDVVALRLPLPATIVRWPCSQNELALVLLPLLRHTACKAAPPLVVSASLSARQVVSARVASPGSAPPC
jgi:CheY-like chemotaxis protein